MKITIEGENLKVSDGYHTIEELYEHRILLFIALCKQYRTHNHYQTWMSLKHSDGSSFKGWFIMGINEDKGKQISYHLPIRFWLECTEVARVLENAPIWDGHTSNDVLERLKQL